MTQKNITQKAKTRLIFKWDNIPEHIYIDIIKRMEFYGFKTFREYFRFVINKDLDEWKDELYGKTAND